MISQPFSREEYVTRLKKVRAAMDHRGMDLLIVNDVANQHYLTAYDGWSFYTPQVVLVPIEDEEPVWIGREMDAAGGKLTAWMGTENVVGFPENYVQQTDRHPMGWIAEWIRNKGWGSRRIGIELEAYYYSPKAHSELTRGLPDATWIDADLLINWVRAVKSPAEIDYLRKAARLAEIAVQTAFRVIEPGVRECDAAAQIRSAQVAGIPDYYGDLTALPATILGGENASAPHLMWTDRRFGSDETIALELAGSCRRYTAGLARTMQLGTMPTKVRDTSNAVLEGMEAVLAAIKPGVLAQDVELAWRTVIGQYGLKKASRIGYSVGIAYPPDWGEHTISLRPGDRTELRSGNVLHSILGMWMDGWGIEVSETILVTETGCETLTNLPRAIFEK